MSYFKSEVQLELLKVELKLKSIIKLGIDLKISKKDSITQNNLF